MTMLFIACGILIASVGLDQLTKALAVVNLQGEPSYPLWQDVLHFTYVENRGAAFGMLSENRWIFMVLSTVAILGILFYLFWFRPQDKLLVISLAMIAGGGIGNMIDRILLGYVVDFIDFTLIDFAVFNVADSFVTVGAGILILYLVIDIVKDIKRSRQAAQKNSEAVDGEDGHV
jgi:signal peptidase II